MDGRLGRARAIQRTLEAFYGLEGGPDVAEFVRAAPAGERETLLVRQSRGALELALLLPEPTKNETLDDHAQLVEGVSHFVYVAERARIELPATELELELQAEVDQFVVMAFDGVELAVDRGATLRRALYEDARHLHDADSERGVRYRLAHGLAERLVGRLLFRAEPESRRPFLIRFYRGGQADKIRLATAC